MKAVLGRSKRNQNVLNNFGIFSKPGFNVFEVTPLSRRNDYGGFIQACKKLLN
jgi:hypothetical protein